MKGSHFIGHQQNNTSFLLFSLCAYLINSLNLNKGLLCLCRKHVYRYKSYLDETSFKTATK